eukprot:3990341-Amphidinium_carterae.4
MVFGTASGSVVGMPFSDPADLSGISLSTTLRVETTTADLDGVLVSSSCTALLESRHDLMVLNMPCSSKCSLSTIPFEPLDFNAN